MQQETIANNLQKTTIYNLPYDIFYCISKFVNVQKLADSSKTLKKLNEKLYKYNLNLFGTIMYHNNLILKNTIADDIQLKFKIKPIYDSIDFIDYRCQININFDNDDTQNINKSLIIICEKLIKKLHENNCNENIFNEYHNGPLCGTMCGSVFKIYYRKYNNSYGEYSITIQFKFNDYLIIFNMQLVEKNGVILENYFRDYNSYGYILTKL